MIQQIIGGVIVALITAAGTYWGSKKQSVSANEGTYAAHMPELWARIEQLTSERDDLKQQVMNLQTEVNKATATIDELTRQVGALKNRMEES
jgi:outer membrane murein-binding lipoprotein Lpp